MKKGHQLGRRVQLIKWFEMREGKAEFINFYIHSGKGYSHHNVNSEGKAKVKFCLVGRKRVKSITNFVMGGKGPSICLVAIKGLKLIQIFYSERELNLLSIG